MNRRRRPGPAPPGPPGPPGAAIRRASWAGTGVFAGTAIGAAAWPGPLAAPALTVSVALFAGGCTAFATGLVVAAARSRSVRMELAQIWFLAGPPTPAPVRRSLLGSLAVEIVVGLATAGVRPYTSLAAGVLVPMWGLGLGGLWSARHGRFPPRPPDVRRDGGGLPSGRADQRERDP